MEITQQCVVALTWTLKDTLGETLDVLEEPVDFLVGGGDLLEAIESALQGHGPGATMDLHLEPEQAFGDYNEELVFLEPRELFPDLLEEGNTFEGLPEGSNPDAPKEVLYTVTEIYPEHVVLDGNHPLAGIAIRLSSRSMPCGKRVKKKWDSVPQAPDSSRFSRNPQAAHCCTEASPTILARP